MTKRRVGLVHCITGPGKGKTSAAVGMLVRALGHGWKVCYCSFHKDPRRWGYGEFKTLQRLGVPCHVLVPDHEHFHASKRRGEIARESDDAFRRVVREVFPQSYDLVVLDEALVSVRDGYASIGELEGLIRAKPRRTELVLTGRMNGPIAVRLERLADYVSCIDKRKHPYDRGIRGREGIEF
jgi:cob(I)alamin adenosyltransferase